MDSGLCWFLGVVYVVFTILFFAILVDDDHDLKGIRRYLIFLFAMTWPFLLVGGLGWLIASLPKSLYHGAKWFFGKI